MRKLNLFAVLMIGIFLFSCTSDDNTSDENQDIIVDSWKPLRVVNVYSESGEIEFVYDNCERQSVIVFSANMSFSTMEFFNDENGDCIEDDTFQNGSWEKLSDTQYQITEIYFDSDLNENVTETYIPDSITFPNDNMMRIRYIENIEENGETLEFTYTEFERI